jgi:hypothetical protein
MSKLTYAFSYAFSKNFYKYSIVDKLIYQIEGKFNDLVENDVLSILRAY